MKVIATNNYKKIASCLDDQPNYINRDNKNQGQTIFLDDNVPDSKEEIIKKWKSKKRNVKPEEFPKPSI
jgi:hypothetical protein